MTGIGLLPLGVPVACTLAAGAGRARVEQWRGFDDDYLLSSEDRGDEYVAHYARVPDSEERLAALVRAESHCCSFVDWTVEPTRFDLRLVVRGTPEALASLGIR